jgi:hypothetical protein
MGVHHAYPAFFVSRFLKEMNRLAVGRGGFMVLTRGGGIGSGRNPYLWAGDQMRTWNKLDDQLLAVLNSGMSGMPFMSYDMGGYQYDGWKLEPAGVVGGETVFVKRGKTLTAEEEAGLAPGDYLLLPEMSAEKPGRVCLPGTLAPDRLRVVAAERADIPFATALQDDLRCAPAGTEDLLLMKGDRRIASGRLSKLGMQPAFAVEALC